MAMVPVPVRLPDIFIVFAVVPGMVKVPLIVEFPLTSSVVATIPMLKFTGETTFRSPAIVVLANSVLVLAPLRVRLK